MIKATQPIAQEELPATVSQARNRVTIVEYIQFQERLGGHLIVPAGTPYAYELDSEEMPFQRKFKAGTDWKELPGLSDWLDDIVGLIKVENIEGQFLQVNPTDAEKQSIARRIIEVGVKVGDVVQPFALVHPGRSIRIEAVPQVKYAIRCLQDSATYWLHAFPR